MAVVSKSCKSDMLVIVITITSTQSVNEIVKNRERLNDQYFVF